MPATLGPGAGKFHAETVAREGEDDTVSCHPRRVADVTDLIGGEGVEAREGKVGAAEVSDEDARALRVAAVEEGEDARGEVCAVEDVAGEDHLRLGGGAVEEVVGKGEASAVCLGVHGGDEAGEGVGLGGGDVGCARAGGGDADEARARAEVEDAFSRDRLGVAFEVLDQRRATGPEVRPVGSGAGPGGSGNGIDAAAGVGGVAQKVGTFGQGRERQSRRDHLANAGLVQTSTRDDCVPRSR